MWSPSRVQEIRHFSVILGCGFTQMFTLTNADDTNHKGKSKMLVDLKTSVFFVFIISENSIEEQNCSCITEHGWHQGDQIFNNENRQMSSKINQIVARPTLCQN
jgi:hypothetical protein